MENPQVGEVTTESSTTTSSSVTEPKPNGHAAVPNSAVEFRRSLKVTYRLKAKPGCRVRVRFPSDEETIQYLSKLQPRFERIGSKTRDLTAPGEVRAARDLFDSIRLEVIGEGALDDADKISVINRILFCYVGGMNGEPDDADETTLESRITESNIEVPLRLLSVADGINTFHILRMPTEAELRSYRKNSVSRFDGPKTVEVRQNYHVTSEFYDTLLERLEGYPSRDEVPVRHKITVIAEAEQLIQQWEQEESLELDFT